MKKLHHTLPVFVFIFLITAFLFSSCRAKKVPPPPPAPVEVAPVVTPPPAPAPEPDTDGDSVPDAKDNCPTQAGPATNNGCPEPPKINFSTQTILFEFNSAILKTSSYPVLDGISILMKQFPDQQFSVNGHSSLEGTESHNMFLSVDRANAVKSYLTTSGVKSSNLIANGFGETVPLNDNKTEAERQQNRRVEISKL